MARSPAQAGDLMTLPAAVTFYLEHGLHLFPAKGKGPHPVLPKAPPGEGGFKQATTDPELLGTWYAAAPDAGVGCHLGPSGLVVVEFEGPDRESGAGDPEAARKAVEAYAGPDALPPTWTAQSPSGGLHLFYRWPHGKPLPRCSFALPPSAVEQGMDHLRSGAMGSTLPARLDAAHEGRVWLHLPAEGPAMAPAWMVNQADQHDTELQAAARRRPDVAALDDEGAEHLIARAVERIEQCTPGTRHEVILREAGTAAVVARAHGCLQSTQERVLAAVRTALVDDPRDKQREALEFARWPFRKEGLR